MSAELSEEDSEKRGARNRVRVMTVSYAPHPFRYPVPLMRLQGLWLESLGWRVGEKVIVDADSRSIQIHRIDGEEDPPQL